MEDGGHADGLDDAGGGWLRSSTATSHLKWVDLRGRRLRTPDPEPVVWVLGRGRGMVDLVPKVNLESHEEGF